MTGFILLYLLYAYMQAIVVCRYTDQSDLALVFVLMLFGPFVTFGFLVLGVIMFTEYLIKVGK